MPGSFFHLRVRMPQASSPPRTLSGLPARPGELGTTWAAIIAAALAASVLPAQAQFTSITGFGDSYADTGAAPGGAFRLLGIPCPNNSPLPTCRFTGSTNFVNSLQSIYGLPGLTNYAIGGARTYNSNTLQGLSEGFPYEVQQLVLNGTHFTNTDLIALSIGGNDMSAIDLSGLATDAQRTALVESSATNSAKNAAAGVEQLAGVGARNIAWLSTGSSKWFPEPPNFVQLRVSAVSSRTTSATPGRTPISKRPSYCCCPLLRRVFASSFSTSESCRSAWPPIRACTVSPAPPIARPGPVRLPLPRPCKQISRAAFMTTRSTRPALQWRSSRPIWRTRSMRRPPWFPRAASPRAWPRVSPRPCSAASTPNGAFRRPTKALRAAVSKARGLSMATSITAAATLNVSFSPRVMITTPSVAWPGPNTGSIRGCSRRRVRILDLERQPWGPERP